MEITLVCGVVEFISVKMVIWSVCRHHHRRLFIATSIAKGFN